LVRVVLAVPAPQTVTRVVIQCLGLLLLRVVVVVQIALAALFPVRTVALAVAPVRLMALEQVPEARVMTEELRLHPKAVVAVVVLEH